MEQHLEYAKHFFHFFFAGTHESEISAEKQH